MSPSHPCSLDSLLKDDSLVVELVEELVSVASGVLIAVVLVLECIKGSLNSIVLSLDVGKKSSCQVSVVLDESINLNLKELSFVGSASILNTGDLFSKSNSLSLLCFLPLAKPLNGGSSLVSLCLSHVVNVLLNGVEVFVIEVLFLWALVVWAWFVSLVSILRFEVVLQVCDLFVNLSTDSLSAVSELFVELFSCCVNCFLKVSSFKSTVCIAGIKDLGDESFEILLIVSN